ncbi:MAG TPA: hypothetical protein PLG77_01965 [Burkholderiaceae bacterium]|nr:hypothetical protein [Burkholderiaceae bacterium]
MAVHGALIEYSGQFIGPVPNIVVFQFNPEQLARTIRITPNASEPDRAQRAQSERTAAAGPPVEEVTVKLSLSAAEDLGTEGPFSGVTRAFGIGPQIAALEKMAYPPGGGGGLIGAAIDAIGSAISSAVGAGATRPIPREQLPKLLFIWGPTRVLPVSITTLRINEQEYDDTLNPSRAEVEIGLRVAEVPASDDLIAQGALLYTRTVKEAQAIAQMARGIASLPDILPI